MNDQANGFLLKILSGLQFGVEVALSEGTYSFGNSPDCDIQFADVTLEPVHGRIRLRGGKLDIRAETGALATSSGLTIAAGTADWHEIAQLDIIEAGTTRFAVGGTGARWSTLASAASHAPQPTTRTVAAPGRAGGVAMGVLGVLLVAGLTVGGVVYAGRDPLGTGAVVEEMRPPGEFVRSAIAALPFSSALVVTEAVDGTIDVQGYVQLAVERRAVNNALAETGVQTRRRIWVRESIENEVAELLRSQGVDLGFTLSATGELTLTGTLLDADQAARITALVRDDVFGLSTVRDEIRTAPWFLGQANLLLDSVRLRDRVILRLDGPLIEATGVVTTEQIDGWVGFIQVYARRYADLIPLRSFVTLESAAGAVGEPIVIGDTTGDIAGRVITPDALSPGAPTEPMRLFAVPQSAEPLRPTPEGEVGADPALDVPVGAVSEREREELIGAALARLSRENPQLYTLVSGQIAAGQLPSLDQVQQAAAILDAQLVLRATPDGPQPAILLPGLAEPVSLVQIGEVIARSTLGPADSEPSPPDPAASAQVVPVGALVAAGNLLESLFAPARAEELSPPPAPVASGAPADRDASDAAPAISPAAVQTAPQSQDGATAAADAGDAEPGPADGSQPPAQAALPDGPEVGSVAALAAGLLAGPPGDTLPQAAASGNEGGLLARLQAATATGAPDEDLSDLTGQAPAVPSAETSPEPTGPEPGEAAADGPSLGPATDTDGVARPGAVLTALPYEPSATTGALSGTAQRIVLAASRLAAIQSDPESGRQLFLTPDDGGRSLLDLVSLQGESLQRGETLLRMPAPLSARPVALDPPRTCWEGSRILVEALPATLLMLDLFSLHSSLDLSAVEPDLRPVLMEAALSPMRIERCLSHIGTPYAMRLASTSAFLNESRRNDDFSQFLFRNVPPFDLPGVGVNLHEDRYVQAADGTKLREGGAPDLGSRLSVIGDLGALFRVEDGWRVWLYPQSLSWRIVDDWTLR